jgi:hypothetical protein
LRLVPDYREYRSRKITLGRGRVSLPGAGPMGDPGLRDFQRRGHRDQLQLLQQPEGQLGAVRDVPAAILD